MIRRGGVYIIDFGKRYQSNIGKRRPAVVISSDHYLEIVRHLKYPSILVIPLTTDCVDNPANLLRVQISQKGLLSKKSEVIINWSCSVDLENIDLETGPLALLAQKELQELEEKYMLYCGISCSL